MIARHRHATSQTCLIGVRELRRRFIVPPVILLVFAVTILCQPLAAQEERYLVTTDDGLASLYDLASNSFIQATKTSLGATRLQYGQGLGRAVSGPNNRLAFVVSSDYVAVLDTTINREVARYQDGYPVDNLVSAALSSDGKFLLMPKDAVVSVRRDGEADVRPSLYMIDTTQFKLLRRIDLSSAFRQRPRAIVTIANKAYVFPTDPSSTEKIAVVDLSSYSVSSIPLPYGLFNGHEFAGVVPDGSTLVVIEDEYSDHKYHVLLISTATDTVVRDMVLSANYSNYQALAITPDGSDPSKIFGYVAADGGAVAVALDLRSNSPTYGQVLPNTAVALTPNLYVYSTAVNSDGSRLIAGGSNYSPQTPNLDVIDTAKMFSDPTHALIAEVTVDNGVSAYDICTGFFSTIPPNTAPVVTGVSGDVTNDSDQQIQITGGNFQQGALVRIGSMDRLPATINGGNSLTVTVPKNAPAGKALDIVVTNPEAQESQDQQNQSGLLSGQFSILPNPRFQPQTQFATVNDDASFSVYDISQKTMVNVQSAVSNHTLYWPAFNVDGKELYLAGENYFPGDQVVVPVDLTNNTPGTDITLPGQYVASWQSLAASRDPGTGKPVINIVWTDYNYSDLYVSVIDTDSGSPNFNTIIRTFHAGLNTEPYPDAMTVSPDGKFAYIWYVDNNSSLGIMNLANGTFTHVTLSSLGVSDFPRLLSLSPDGKWLLLPGYSGRYGFLRVFDLADPIHPKAVGDIPAFRIPGGGYAYFDANYQVVGDKLYLISVNGLAEGGAIVVVFNFRPNEGNFRARGYSSFPTLNFSYGYAFSADGNYFYVADYLYDRVAVLDTSTLNSGRHVPLTYVRAPYFPFAMDVSPVPPPMSPVVGQRRSKRILSSKTR